MVGAKYAQVLSKFPASARTGTGAIRPTGEPVRPNSGPRCAEAWMNDSGPVLPAQLSVPTSGAPELLDSLKHKADTCVSLVQTGVATCRARRRSNDA